MKADTEWLRAICVDLRHDLQGERDTRLVADMPIDLDVAALRQLVAAAQELLVIREREVPTPD